MVSTYHHFTVNDHHYHDFGYRYTIRTIHLQFILIVMLSSRREFIELLLFCTFLCIGYYWTSSFVFFYISLLFFVVGIFLPSITQPIIRAFHQLMLWIGHLQSFVLLSLIYLFVLTPISLLKRVLMKEKVTSTPQFKKRGHVFTADDVQQMW